MRENSRGWSALTFADHRIHHRQTFAEELLSPREMCLRLPTALTGKDTQVYSLVVQSLLDILTYCKCFG